jgi:hypothetical protein
LTTAVVAEHRLRFGRNVIVELAKVRDSAITSPVRRLAEVSPCPPMLRLIHTTAFSTNNSRSPESDPTRKRSNPIPHEVP